jgi:hypothetical protein
MKVYKRDYFKLIVFVFLASVVFLAPLICAKNFQAIWLFDMKHATKIRPLEAISVLYFIVTCHQQY